MITAELTRKIDLLPYESYNRVESFVEQLIEMNYQANKESAFRTFIGKMAIAEKYVQENSYYTEDEVEEELAKI